MAFLSPLFWTAVVAISVPIFLHLTRRHVKRPLPFASLMFLKRIPVHETRRRRIRHLFLFLLRCLALLLLVAAFSQPVLENWSLASIAPGARESAVLLVDRSLSMSRPEMEAEVEGAVQSVISELRTGDEVSVIQFGSRAEIVVPWTSDLQEVRQAFSTLWSPSFETTGYAEAFKLAVEQMETASSPARRLILISDLQQSGLDLVDSDLEIPSGIQFDLRDLGRSDRNLFVEDVRVDRRVYGERYPHPILARITAVGGEAEETTVGEVSLFLEEELIDRRNFELRGESSATVSFPPMEVPDGISRGRLVLDSEDPLPADDAFYFVIEKATPFSVSILEDRPGESQYLAEALAAGGNLAFEAQVVDRRSWNESRVVILDDLAAPPSEEELRDFLQRGGGVVIALGSRVDPDRYQDLAKWLPGVPREKRFARTSGKPFIGVVETVAEHPIFEVFRTSSDNALSSVQLYGYWSVDVADEARVLARLSGGDPLLIEREVGNGRVILFASAVGRVWSDFALRSAFVPFWQQLVSHVSQHRKIPAAVKVNEVFSLQAMGEWGPGEERKWDILDPTGRRLVPLGSEGPPYLRLDRPGHFEVRREKSTDWVGVNVVEGESDLTPVTADEFLAALRSTQVKATVMAEESGEAISSGQSLWWILILAAGLLLLLESWWANRTSSGFRGEPVKGGIA